MKLNGSHIQVGCGCATQNQKPVLPFVAELSDARMWRQLNAEEKIEFARKISLQLAKTLCDKSGEDNDFEKLALFAAGRHLPLRKYSETKALSMLVEAGVDVKRGSGTRFHILRWSRVTSDDAYRVLCESQSPASMYFELPWGDANCVDAWTLIREMKTLDGEDMQARLLLHMGAEVRTFNPTGLPLPEDAPETHPKVVELRDLTTWAEGMVWCSPERHGAMTGIMKTQIDWIPLTLGAIRPTQGKTLAVMQVSGGSQSFNAVNQLRVLGRWMRMITIPNQSSVAMAYKEFDEAGRMKPSADYDRVVDVMEELVKFTLLTRDISPYLVDRYSERKEAQQALSERVGLAKI